MRATELMMLAYFPDDVLTVLKKLVNIAEAYARAARDETLPVDRQLECARCNEPIGSCRRDCHQCGAILCDHDCEDWHLEKDCKGEFKDRRKGWEWRTGKGRTESYVWQDGLLHAERRKRVMAALPAGESPAAAPLNADRREIVTPADPHDCRCGERGAYGTGEHYQIVADVETKRGTRVPVCVNHIGNYAAYPDNYRISIRAAAPAAPIKEANGPDQG